MRSSKIMPAINKKGNTNLISDVAVAAVFLESAFVSACFNVEINLKRLGQEKLTKVINKELDQRNKVIQKIRKNMEVGVGKIIRG